VFIPVHYHLFFARLSCVFCQAFPRLYVCMTVSWIPYTLPAPRRICLLYCLYSRFCPCLPVHRLRITLPAPCRMVCCTDGFPGFDPACLHTDYRLLCPTLPLSDCLRSEEH